MMMEDVGWIRRRMRMKDGEDVWEKDREKEVVVVGSGSEGYRGMGAGRRGEGKGRDKKGSERYV